MLKILVVSSSPLYVIEGESSRAVQLCQSLMGLGHSVQMLSFNTRGWTSKYVLGGIQIHDYPVPFLTRWTFYPRLALLLGKKILKLADRFDVIHGIGGYSLPIALAKLDPRRLGNRHLVSTLTGVLADNLSFRIRGEHNNSMGLASVFRRFTSALCLPAAAAIGTISYNQFDLNIADCKHVAKLAKKFYHINSEKLVVIYPSIDFKKFHMNRNDGDEKILYVGKLNIGKGVQNLLKAYVKARFEARMRMDLVIVGRGYLVNWIRGFLKRNSLEKSVEIVEAEVSQANWPAIYNRGRIFVMPSVYEPSLSTALLEAMATGRVPLVSDVGGYKEVIDNGVNGLLFNPRDIDMFAEKLVSLSEDEKLMSRLGYNASKTIEQRFNLEKNVTLMEKAYLRLLEGD